MNIVWTLLFALMVSGTVGLWASFPQSFKSGEAMIVWLLSTLSLSLSIIIGYTMYTALIGG